MAWPCDVMQGPATARHRISAISCPTPFLGVLNKVESARGSGEVALKLGLGDGRNAHLSLTSSFTPELSWRACFIMSYSR